jgi:hypothetical protein
VSSRPLRVSLALLLLILVATCCSGSPSSRSGPRQEKAGRVGPNPPSPLSAQDCLDRSKTTVVSGVQDRQYRVDAPPADETVDARLATSTAFPFATLYPFSFGKRRAATHLCLLGGLVVGQQSRDLTWDQVKAQYDGAGARIAADGWYVVDGLRVENLEDGIDPRGSEGVYPKGGDGFVLRNLYFQYIRDDCVENDDIAGGVIADSLFDGCNTGISERPTRGNRQYSYPAPSGETLTITDVLLHLQPMPGPRGHSAATLGHGELFKWSRVANRLVLRDSVFLVEARPNGGRSDFPKGTLATNVTVVWLGGGPFPGTVPPGVTITTDRSVWDHARDQWLRRHGCTSFSSCTALVNPGR